MSFVTFSVTFVTKKMTYVISVAMIGPTNQICCYELLLVSIKKMFTKELAGQCPAKYTKYGYLLDIIASDILLFSS